MLLLQGYKHGQIGQFQKISIPYHGRLPYLNSPLPSEFPKCIIPPCPRISMIVTPPPPPVRIFHFFVKPFGITCRVRLCAQFGLFYGKLFQMTLLLFSTAGYRGSHYDFGNSGMKILKTLILKFSPYHRSTDTTYINFTLPQTGTEH